MIQRRLYTTNLSKAQGLIPETIELLGLWEPGMAPVKLKARARESGALGKSTQTRVDDVVGRGFAQRYLIEDGLPARYLKKLARDASARRVLRQLMLIYTARSQAILHDFITEVYWRKAGIRAGEVSKQDTRDFVERAKAAGRTRTSWSDAMTERVTRYLLGTLEDFEWIVENRSGRRQVRPPMLLPEAALYLAYDLHFHGLEGHELVQHTDWRLFGLSAADVLGFLEKLAAQQHLQVQNAGVFLRIEWVHSNMENVIDAILERKV